MVIKGNSRGSDGGKPVGSGVALCVGRLGEATVVTSRCVSHLANPVQFRPVALT